MQWIKRLIWLQLLLITGITTAQTREVPFIVDSLFNQRKPQTLGLSFVKGGESFTVFSPGKDDNKYNHGVVLFPFKGMLYAQWQSSEADEDATDTRVLYTGVGGYP